MFMRTSSSCRRLFAPVVAALMLVTSSSAQAYVTAGRPVRTSTPPTSIATSTSIPPTSTSIATSTLIPATLNVNVNRNVNVSGGCCYNNVGVGGAVAAGVVAGATAAVVGSAIAASALPPSCSTVVVNGLAYRSCGGAWYQPQYAGSQVTYIVVNPPQ